MSQGRAPVHGAADPATGRPVEPETLFNVFSVTKAVTATALHIQDERGLVDYDEPVAIYWPDFAANGKQGATVRHVLTHRAGVPQMPVDVTAEMMCDWAAMASAIAALPRCRLWPRPARRRIISR
nr:beta-lactamase family protein [Novosphingobium sp. ERN07]